MPGRVGPARLFRVTTTDQDRAELWRQVRDDRLDKALARMSQFGQWRPDDPADRVLFARLAAVDPALAEAMSRPVVTELPVTYTDHVAFAPDLSEVAVVAALREPRVIEVFSLPDGRPMAQLEVTADREPISWEAVLHLGDAIVHTEMYHAPNRHWRVVRHRRPQWSKEILADIPDVHGAMLMPVPGGFVVGGDRDFHFGDATGPIRGPLTAPSLGSADLRLLATDPSTGRMALVVDHEDDDEESGLYVLDRDLRVLGRTIDDTYSLYDGWFHGPDWVLTHGVWHIFKSWEVRDGDLAQDGHHNLDWDNIKWGPYDFPLGITSMPERGVVAIYYDDRPPEYLTGQTLTPVEQPPAVFGDRFPVWVAAGGGYAAFEGSGRVLEVCDLRLAELLTTPLRYTTPADLDKARALPPGDPSTTYGAALELLRASLEHRFNR